jgi:hypothetical protein
VATTASGDVKIYQPQMQGAFIETLQQNVDGFNAASNGALIFRTRPLKGQYEYEAFFDEVSNIARRDPSAESSSTVVSTKLTQDDFIGVKLSRRNGPYEWNISSAKLAGFDPARFSIAVGEMTAMATPKEMLDRALGALESKLDATTGLEHDATDGTIDITDLNTGISKFGDAASRVRLWVMHSKPFFDLVGAALGSTASVFASDVFGGQVFSGLPVTLGRPVFVTDSPSLFSYADVSTGAPVYSTLGLVAGAAMIDVTEPPLAVAEGPITGSDNLYIRWQAEYSYNLKLKGLGYKVSTGANPTDAQVATGSNWETKVASNKLLPGVIIRSL